MSKGVRSRRLRREIEEAYREREEQLAKAVHEEVTMMHLDEAPTLVLAAVPQQRRWYQPTHGTHRPIGDVEHLRDVTREARHKIIDLRDKVVTSLELEPWMPLKRINIDLEEAVGAFALN